MHARVRRVLPRLNVSSDGASASMRFVTVDKREKSGLTTHLQLALQFKADNENVLATTAVPATIKFNFPANIYKFCSRRTWS